MSSPAERPISTTQTQTTGRKSNKTEYVNPRNDKTDTSKRTYTAFQWMNTASAVTKTELRIPQPGLGQRDVKLQGPHVIAHVTLNEAAAKHVAGGGGMQQFLGTGFAPPPEVVAHMIKAETKFSNLKDGDLTIQHANDYLAKYAKKYDKAAKTSVADTEAMQRRVMTLMNMQPTATYAWGVGSSTRAEIKGKGESREVAQSDLSILSRDPTANVATVDRNYQSHFPEPLKRAAARNIEDLGTIFKGGSPRQLTIKDIF